MTQYEIQEPKERTIKGKREKQKQNWLIVRTNRGNECIKMKGNNSQSEELTTKNANMDIKEM